MYVVEVIPLTRGSQIDTLTYYARYELQVGDVIDIPLRSKKQRGLVVGVTPLGFAKSALKTATFTLKKLPAKNNVQPLSPLLHTVATEYARELPATLGAILYAMLPKEVREGTATIDTYTLQTQADDAEGHVSVLASTTEDRFHTYKRAVREAFAHRGSVLFLVPSVADIATAYDALHNGIKERVVVFNPYDGVRTRARAYEALNDLSTTKLIIASPAHAFLDRQDITTIIIEGANSTYYRKRTRPYLDVRDIQKRIARTSGRTLLLGDILPASEDEHRRRTDSYHTEGESPRRYSFENTVEIVRLKKEERDAKNPFPLLYPEITKRLAGISKNREKVLLLSARRGLAPVVLCRDCGFIFRCPDSGAPYSLMVTKTNGEERRIFYCSTSGKRIRAKDTCTQCGSWRLREQGIGIQNIESLVRNQYPETPLTLFDHTTATTHKKARALIAEFQERDSGILLATPMVLPYIHEPVDVSVITSYEATRAIPTWRADEELLRLLLTLREKTNDTLYIQAKAESDDTVLALAKEGAVEKFYTEELALRKTLSYPPFSVFTHLTFKETGTQEAELQELLAGTGVRFYAGHTPSIRYGLIRTRAQEWPDSALIERLHALPPWVRTEINPYRIV